MKYSILPAYDWYNLYVTKRLKSNYICLTFDDNLKGQYDIAFPILDHLGLTGFWFVYTSPLIGEIEKIELYRYFRCTFYENIDDFYNAFYAQVEIYLKDKMSNLLSNFSENDYLKHFSFYSLNDKIFRFLRDEILKTNKYEEVMNQMLKSKNVDKFDVSDKIWFTKEQLIKLSNKGNIIGLHSHTHPTRLNELDYNSQLEEYDKNKRILESIIKINIRTAAHPTNSYNQDTFAIFNKLGVKLAFRSNMESGYYSNFEIPRLDHAFLK